MHQNEAGKEQGEGAMTTKEKVQDYVDEIVRDEGYDGAYGTMSEQQFNNMAARIAQLVINMLEEEGVL